MTSSEPPTKRWRYKKPQPTGWGFLILVGVGVAESQLPATYQAIDKVDRMKPDQWRLLIKESLDDRMADLVFKATDGKYVNMDHWEEYDFQFKSKRWGHYQVRLTYKLTHTALGAQ